MQGGMIVGAFIVLIGTMLPESIGFPIAAIGALIGVLCLAKDWLNKRPNDRQHPHF